jgi:hypothetical protein
MKCDGNDARHVTENERQSQELLLAMLRTGCGGMTGNSALFVHVPVRRSLII